MKVEIVIGMLCITIIIGIAVGMGYNGVLAGSGVAIIGGLLGWQGKKAADKRGGNIDATTAGLKRAGFTDAQIWEIISKVKGGK